MSESLGATLFQSTTRSMLLELLFLRGVAASVSELARRSGLSPRSVGNEVRHLLPTGLILMETVGNANVVRGNAAHPAARELRALLQAPGALAPDPSDAMGTRESLAAYGAPLAGVRPKQHDSVNETLVRGLELSRDDGTVLRVLPLILAKHASRLDWTALVEDARRRKLKAELGVLLELTAELVNAPELKARAAKLRDRRLTTMRFFPNVKNRYEAELAKRRSPKVARRWGFWMNMSEDTFRQLLEKHRA